MAFTYDVTTNRGKVRLLCFDRVDAGHVYEDAEVDAFLSLADSDVFLAASLACRDMQANATRNFASVTLGAFTMSGDGPRSWAELAQKYEEMAYARAANDSAVDFIDMGANGVFGYAELEVVKALRGEDD